VKDILIVTGCLVLLLCVCLAVSTLVVRSIVWVWEKMNE
jgi:hypothetical protein